MPVTKTQVKKALMPDEIDYNKASQLGPEALPHLKEFIKGNDEALASKATFLAGLIKDKKTVDILLIAAASPSDLVRIAAAASAKHLKAADANKILCLLANDASYGVRKMVLLSAPQNPSSELVNKMKLIASSDPKRKLRQRASVVLEKPIANP